MKWTKDNTIDKVAADGQAPNTGTRPSAQTHFDLTQQLKFPLDVVNQDLISKNGFLWMGVCHRNCVELIKLVMQ